MDYRPMTKSEAKNHHYGKGEASSSLNQALLDEFFCIIASIAVRLTKNDYRDNNTDDSTSTEVSKP